MTMNRHAPLIAKRFHGLRNASGVKPRGPLGLDWRFPSALHVLRQ